jgi:multiple sugar transport system permease protein
MKLFKGKRNRGESVLTLRLWRFTGSALLNLLIFILLAVYLSPLPYMVATAFKTPEQVTAGPVAPLYPAVNKMYHYQGEDHLLMEVPTAAGLKQLALVNAHITYSEFVDPQHPEKGLIRWNGYWHSLKQVFVFRLNFEAFQAWLLANLPLGMLNTFIVIGLTEIGVLASSIAVAYGFSRFRIPGGKWLFYLLIATIMIPDSITLIPTYVTWINLLNVWIPHQAFLQFPFPIPWGWLPLIAQHLFSSAIFVFLLRQNFLSIPRDLDEAAMLDGAGPLRILTQIILPQSIPVVTTVAMLQFFYIWNEFRISGLYMGANYSLWLLAPRLQYGAPMPGSNPQPSVQSGALVLMLVPVIVLLLFQRFFLKDMVVTGTENSL